MGTTKGGTGVRILGIDPGLALVGYGVIERQGHRLIPVRYGCLRTDAQHSDGARLRHIYEATAALLADVRPDVVALEKLFWGRNVTTALSVGQARGVILLAVEQAGLPVYEYTPMQVKQAVVGYGKAVKGQVQEMVRVLLGLREVPKPDDAADALGVAIAHAHAESWARRVGRAER